MLRKRPSRGPALRRLADRVLEAADLPALAHLLAGELPGTLGVSQVELLLWDRKLESFEALAPGRTRGRAVPPNEGGLPELDARYLLSGGELIETAAGRGPGVLVPLLARSGLVGMLALGAPRTRRGLSRAELRQLSTLAARAALSIENQLYQRELIASERMAALGTMASMLAHDFRGPMTVIRGYAETLLDGVASPQELRERAALIVDMVDRLERMTSETLDFARGSGHLVRRSLGLSKFLDDLASGIELELPGLRVERAFDVPRERELCVDVDKLLRAAQNIAANSRDAMGGSGRLRLSATVEGETGDPRLILILADDGPGVPGEIRGSLFDPFVTRGKKGGTGLGLAVARRFVEEHGGTLELLPEGPGARFRLGLPLRAPEASSPAREGAGLTVASRGVEAPDQSVARTPATRLDTPGKGAGSDRVGGR